MIAGAHDFRFDLVPGSFAWTADLRAVLAAPGGIEKFTALPRYIELVGEAPDSQLRSLAAALGPKADEAGR